MPRVWFLPDSAGWIALVLLLGVGNWGRCAERTAELRFNRDVRPILSSKCYACHGPDAKHREAELRLDTQGGLLEPRGDAPAAVVPGQPAASSLWQRVSADNPEELMPPVDSGKQLSAEEREVLSRWIEQGAPWEGHWSFQPLEARAPPVVDEASFLRDPLDAFVLARMRQQGLQFSPAADPATLLRRLSLDLTGLPPTASNVEAFVADPSDAAYEAHVDRLLASPAHGERMAQWWLDLVRYADSVGYHGDQAVSVFPYRDYVIRAFQENKPFDQFTIEQLAGDLLPGATLEQRIASGYNRLGMMSAEGGVQDKEYLAKYIAERVRNLGGAWLGVTLQCTECHDHKYDPFLTRDFYRLEAFFADIKERGFYANANATGDWGPRAQVPTPEQAQRLTALDQQLAEVDAQLQADTPQLAAQQQTWEQSFSAWTTLVPAAFSSASGAALTLLEDGSLLAGGERPADDVYALLITDPPSGTTALRLEVLPHDSLPKHGPGRAENGNFVLSEIRLAVRAAGAREQLPIGWSHASATFEQTESTDKVPGGRWAAALAIDGDAAGPHWGWGVLGKIGEPNEAVFETAADVTGGPGAMWAISLVQRLDNPQHTLGRFRLSATQRARPVRAEPPPSAAVAAVLAVPSDQRTPEQQREVTQYYRTVAPALEPARQRRREIEAARRELEAQIPTTLVTETVEPRMIRVLARGNWMDESGEVVSPGVPEFLPQLASTGGRLSRLDLARWVVAAENPLTGRTLANRLWKLFFGAGLSRKLDDLGAQGEWPTHPELLDYLARQWQETGWDMRRFIKRLVMSGTYRQSSVATAEQLQRDPDNRWLARQGRFRLDAETVRDNALAISGLLVEQVGGRSVFPYQPAGYWAYLNFPTREWQNDEGPARYRRGLYTHWQRQYLHPALVVFDAPSREECIADRPRSNTPLQALVLLNDPEYVEAASAFAEAILRSGAVTIAERIDWAFRRAVARPARSQEIALLSDLLARQQQVYGQDPVAAEALLAARGAGVGSDLNRPEWAAWTGVARVILNLHETISRN